MGAILGKQPVETLHHRRMNPHPTMASPHKRGITNSVALFIWAAATGAIIWYDISSGEAERRDKDLVEKLGEKRFESMYERTLKEIEKLRNKDKNNS